eukprot:TRINITY_DN34827_c0_g1_i1.p1 TRINITY_DN34827_c0_g1~~TRINITY_DN34827_c0_g1_i1.p1  ORF type:complete len:1003 (-),score=130.78 TRINITY_DN34827_c0_g1_i1:24-2645(-)
MAAGHWIVAIWEDLSSFQFLSAGLVATDLHSSGRLEPNDFLLRAYIWHHIIAASGYISILHLRSCVAVCTFGLIFEIPVLVMNHREFAIVADEIPKWFKKPVAVRLLWQYLVWSFVFARGFPHFVYFFSLLVWWKDLWALPTTEFVVYHMMALFFMLLNYSLFTVVLTRWNDADMRRALELMPNNARHYGSEFGSEVGDDVGIDQNIQKLERCGLEDVAKRDGTSKSGEIWVAIDDSAYNITNFLMEHPGGETVLREHAGKDASEAFHRARHSPSAKIQMLRFMVGPIRRSPERYRIFEHQNELFFTLSTAAPFASNIWAVSMFFSHTNLVDGDILVSGDSFMTSLVPGLCLAIACGGFILFVFTLRCHFPCSWFTPSAFSVSANMTLFVCSFVMVLQPLPSSLPAACPTGFELTAVLLFLLEDLREIAHCGPGPWSATCLLPAIVVIASWFLRGVPELLEIAPGRAYGSLLFAFTSSSIVRTDRISFADTLTMEERWQSLSTWFGRNVLMVPVGLIGLAMVMRFGDKRADEVLQAMLAQSRFNLILMACAANLCTPLISSFNTLSWTTSQAWTARLFALILSSGVVLCNGFKSWRWLFVMGLCLHIGELGHRLRTSFDRSAAVPGGFAMVPPWKLGTQSFLDQFRVSVATLSWKFASSFIEQVVNRALPEELRVFANDLPIFDLGDRVDLGVAAYYARPRTIHRRSSHDGSELGEKPESLPRFLVSNVGHIDTGHKNGLSDMQRTMNALRDVWTEFKEKQPEGLVANVVAVFPFIQGTTSAKELNLSVWNSCEDAHNWYYQSPGHKTITQQHASGNLRTFGNLLASLEPIDKVRFQDRCQRCSRLVEDVEVGKPPPLRCNLCGGRTFDYPLF